MGALSLPASGLIYFDANPVIYSVEKHPVYWPVLEAAWRSMLSKTVELVSSELVLLETLVGPLKSGDVLLAATYEKLFNNPKHASFQSPSRF